VAIEFADRTSDIRIVKALSEVPAIVRELVASGKQIVRVVPDRRSLEEIYLELVGEDS
jgi:hypothetical protein